MDAHDAPVAVQSRRFLARNHIARIFLFELCSTAFLSFMAFSTVYLPPLDVYPRQLNPFHGIVLAIIIYAIVCFSGSFSGANLNPAITVCYFLHKQREKGDLKLFCSYILAQFIGGLLGIVLSRYIYDCGAAVFVS